MDPKTLIQSLGASNSTIPLKRIYLAICQGEYVAAAMLGQCIYLHSEMDSGLFDMTDEDWKQELMVSLRQVRQSKQLLKDLGLVEVTKRKIDGAPTTHYSVNYDRLAELISEKSKEMPSSTVFLKLINSRRARKTPSGTELHSLSNSICSDRANGLYEKRANPSIYIKEIEDRESIPPSSSLPPSSLDIDLPSNFENPHTRIPPLRNPEQPQGQNASDQQHPSNVDSSAAARISAERVLRNIGVGAAASRYPDKILGWVQQYPEEFLRLAWRESQTFQGQYRNGKPPLFNFHDLLEGTLPWPESLQKALQAETATQTPAPVQDAPSNLTEGLKLKTPSGLILTVELIEAGSVWFDNGQSIPITQAQKLEVYESRPA